MSKFHATGGSGQAVERVADKCTSQRREERGVDAVAHRLWNVQLHPCPAYPLYRRLRWLYVTLCNTTERHTSKRPNVQTSTRLHLTPHTAHIQIAMRKAKAELGELERQVMQIVWAHGPLS